MKVNHSGIALTWLATALLFTACGGGAGTTPTTTLNDTGITSNHCYEVGSNVLVTCNSAGAIALSNSQDGMVGRDADSATNSNTDGKLGFRFSSVTGGCVQDNVTGLMWEVKTADGGLRDGNKTYTNFDSTTALQIWNGSNFLAPTQTEIDAPTNSVGLKNSINAQSLCGYSDWRLPSADELQSILDYGAPHSTLDPAIDVTWFPNTQGYAFWSASPYVGNSYPIIAWFIGTRDRYVLNDSRSSSHNVRLVRVGLSPTTPRYTVSTDGQEITDNQAKLIWRRCSEGMNWNGSTCTGSASTFNHEAALQFAATQASTTGTAWRLPNIKELSSISDKALNNPAIDSTTFPITPAGGFWTSTPLLANPTLAWFVNFYGGDANYDDRNLGFYVRLVRAGQ